MQEIRKVPENLIAFKPDYDLVVSLYLRLGLQEYGQKENTLKREYPKAI